VALLGCATGRQAQCGRQGQAGQATRRTRAAAVQRPGDAGVGGACAPKPARPAARPLAVPALSPHPSRRRRGALLTAAPGRAPPPPAPPARENTHGAPSARAPSRLPPHPPQERAERLPVVEHEVAHPQERQLLQPPAARRLPKGRLGDPVKGVLVVALQRVLAGQGDAVGLGALQDLLGGWRLGGWGAVESRTGAGGCEEKGAAACARAPARTCCSSPCGEQRPSGGCSQSRISTQVKDSRALYLARQLIMGA
jgi:hypothetical protein